VVGEAVPDAVLVLCALLLPLLAAVAWQGSRRTPELAWLAAALAGVYKISASFRANHSCGMVCG
jgi:hypothetical protein